MIFNFFFLINFLYDFEFLSNDHEINFGLIEIEQKELIVKATYLFIEVLFNTTATPVANFESIFL